MAFYLEKAPEEMNYPLRNEWVLEAGRDTAAVTTFTYPQFVRNCRELQHFGYVYSKTCAYMPCYNRSGSRIRREDMEIKTEDERLNPGKIFDRIKCSVIRMEFRQKETGKIVYWYISIAEGMQGRPTFQGRLIMWISWEEQDWEAFWYRKIYTFSFEEPIFETVFAMHGLLEEMKGDGNGETA